MTATTPNPGTLALASAENLLRTGRRDNHKAHVEALADLRALLARNAELVAALSTIVDTLDGWADGARIAALSAEERGDDDEQVAQSNTRENYGKLVRIARAALAAAEGGAK
jgi:hypothetical protein